VGTTQPKQKISPKEDSSVSAERFELSTYGLKGRCSAIELRAPSGLRLMSVASRNGGMTPPCERSGLHSIT
jgi:hypothetical protein